MLILVWWFEWNNMQSMRARAPSYAGGGGGWGPAGGGSCARPGPSDIYHNGYYRIAGWERLYGPLSAVTLARERYPGGSPMPASRGSLRLWGLCTLPCHYPFDLCL